MMANIGDSYNIIFFFYLILHDHRCVLKLIKESIITFLVYARKAKNNDLVAVMLGV